MTATERQAWGRRCRIREQRSAVGQAVTDWLHHLPFEHFLTVTFKPPADCGRHRLEFCQRCFKRLADEFSVRLWGPRWKLRRKKTGLYGVVVWEKHKSGAWHAHALLAGTSGRLEYKELHKYVKDDRYLGHSWIEPFRGEHRERAVRYAAKYITKSPGSWSAFGVRWFGGDGLFGPSGRRGISRPLPSDKAR